MKNFSSLVSRNRPGEKNFHHSPACIVECVSKYICSIKKTTTTATKNKKTKNKRNYWRKENICGKYNRIGYIVGEFAPCTFNLLARVVNFSWFFIWISCSFCATREIIVFVKYTLSRTKIFFCHFLFISVYSWLKICYVIETRISRCV